MKNKKGFTLAELLIAVAIIGVLVAISIPIFTSQLEKSRQAVDLANMRSAKAAAVAEWMTDGMPDGYSGYYDASSGTMKDIKPNGYGKSSKNSSEFASELNATGTPNDGTAHFITVTIDGNGVVSLKWGGNDLTTAAGRRQEDIDNMHNITNVLKEEYEKGTYGFAKNYVQVAVFKDGTMAYYMDGRGNSEADVQGLKAALANGNLNTENTPLYSTDAKWANGYIIHIEKNGMVYYKAISASENENKTIGSGWWYKGNITDEDLVN